MQTLRKLIVKEWLNIISNGKNISLIDITNNHYKQLFWLYDNLVFNNQIVTKFNEINAHYNSTNSKLLFPEVDDILIKSKRVCDVVYTIYPNDENDGKHEKHVINIIVQPWIISRIMNCKLKDRKKVFGSSNELECVLIIFEHQIGHVLEILWDVNILEKSPYDEIYGTHGNIYNCATNLFFDNNVVDLFNKLSSPDFIPKPFLVSKQYKYWSNSCSLDTLTMTLLMCKSDIFRNAIFTTNSSLTNYNSKKGLNFKSICSTKDITNEEYFRDFTSRIQSILFDDYNRMLGNTTSQNVVTCSKLRNVLLECYGDMKINKQWVTYNITELYALYTVMFPDLLIGNIPINQLIAGSNMFIKMISDQYEGVFSFWDFVHDAEIEDNNILNLHDWDKFNQEILVFKNGGIPAITKFGSTKSENVDIITYKNGTAKKIKTEMTKSRKFGETILNGKYEMIGAIILEGTKPGQDSGAHYYSYINTLNGWVKFNDIGPKWEQLDEFPSTVLTEKNGNKPEMYFYSLVK